MQSKYNHSRRRSHGSHVELVVAVNAPSLYITVVSAVVGSASIVPTTASDIVDGHPAAASTEETVVAVFGSVSEWLSDTCGPSTGRPYRPRFGCILS